MTELDRYAVFGHPVAHSRSPGIHAAFATATGQALHYGRELCPLDGFEAAVRAFAQRGRGCNVTVPFKFDALTLVGQAGGCVSPRAAQAGAANVLRFEGQGPAHWACDNTDGIGLVRDIEVHAATPLAGRRVLLVGAGGAAAGVLGPLIEAGAAELVLTNRTPAKAEALLVRHAALAKQHGCTLQAAALAAPGERFDVVINASSSSLAGAVVPVPAAVLRRGTLALDLMYGPAATPFLAWAHAHGARARDGLGMLVEQAAEAFFFWRGVRPPTAAVLAAERAAVDGPRT
jgi:shikimate dehydrogenase